MKTISIIVPIFNEQETLNEFYARLNLSLKKDFSQFKHEIIFIDDGSKDKTYEILRQLYLCNDEIKVLRFSRNFGHHIAISAGLDHAKGEFIVMMDGDLQDQPEEIKKLYNTIINGSDVAAGKRIEKKFSYLRRLCSAGFVFVIKNLIDQQIIINNTIFRMITKQVANEIKRLREHNRYIIGIIGWVGFKHSYVPVIHGSRFAGKSKYSLRKQFNLALNAIFSFSDYPLKLISRLGFILVLLSMTGAFYIIFRHVWHGTPVLGWASIITTLIFFSGIQITILGILGEYLGRTYIEIKQRPLYVVAEILDTKKQIHGIKNQSQISK